VERAPRLAEAIGAEWAVQKEWPYPDDAPCLLQHVKPRANGANTLA
jgi:hypothetical protein